MDFDANHKIYVELQRPANGANYWTLPTGEIYDDVWYARVTHSTYFSSTPTHYRVNTSQTTVDYVSDTRYKISGGDVVATGDVDGTLYGALEPHLYTRLTRTDHETPIYG